MSHCVNKNIRRKVTEIPQTKQFGVCSKMKKKRWMWWIEKGQEVSIKVQSGVNYAWNNFFVIKKSYKTDKKLREGLSVKTNNAPRRAPNWDNFGVKWSVLWSIISIRAYFSTITQITHAFDPESYINWIYPQEKFVHLPKNIRNDYLFGECVQETFFFVTLYFNSFSWISNIELLELLRAMHILEFMYKSFSSWHSAETAVYSICYYPSSIQRSIDGGLRQPPIMPLNGAPFRKSGRFSNFHQHAEFLPWSQFIAQVEEYVSHIRYVV